MSNAEHLLLNPGLVENDKDGTSCFLSCMQMAMRSRIGGGVLSFDEMSKIIRRKSGEYSWEYALLTHLAKSGFDVKLITAFDLHRLCKEKGAYMHEYYGDEAAVDQISHSNMANVYEDAAAFVENSSAFLETRVPQQQDLVDLLQSGYYLIPLINQRILQADPGYVAHSVFAYGYSARGIRIHNPGPPATCASEIAWDLFLRAWSSPSESARQLIAIRHESELPPTSREKL